MGDSNLSDHLPVRLVLQLQGDQRTGSCYKMNGSFLKDPKLHKVWSSSPPHFEFLGNLRRTVKWYKHYCLLQAQQRRAMEVELRQRLSTAQEALQADPTVAALQKAVEDAQEDLAQFEDWRIEGQQLRARIRWKGKGD